MIGCPSASLTYWSWRQPWPSSGPKAIAFARRQCEFSAWFTGNFERGSTPKRPAFRHKWHRNRTMKWVLFLVLLSSILPLRSWLRRNPAKHPFVWTVFGFLVIQHSPLHFFFAPIYWATCP